VSSCAQRRRTSQHISIARRSNAQSRSKASAGRSLHVCFARDPRSRDARGDSQDRIRNVAPFPGDEVTANVVATPPRPRRGGCAQALGAIVAKARPSGRYFSRRQPGWLPFAWEPSPAASGVSSLWAGLPRWWAGPRAPRRETRQGARPRAACSRPNDVRRTLSAPRGKRADRANAGDDRADRDADDEPCVWNGSTALLGY
jgi:hypothetical protein